MLLIPCPWCGPRDEIEFRCAGQGHIRRAEPYDQVSDDEWRAYLFDRVNPKGVHHERWVHEGGCRRWFNLVRDTTTHVIGGAYVMGAKPPEPGADASAEARP